MYLIKDELTDNAKQLDIKLELLDENTAKALRDLMGRKFIDSNSRGNYLWERLINGSILTDPMGWSYIGDIVGDDPCIIMFHENDGFHMARIDNGRDLTDLLGECFGFEFYIMDEQASYLICFNHHDQLICVGEAKNRFADMQNNYPKGQIP